MTCANHFELEATAYCRECGKPMCPECQRPALGSVYCAQHVPAPAPPAASSAFTAAPPPPFAPPPPPPLPSDPALLSSPYTAPRAQAGDARREGGPVPALAFILGFLFPGVGAIYNSQYAKGLIHALIFGLIVSALSGGHNSFAPLLGIFLAIWIFYMAFEAYHTARKRRWGMSVDEFSSVVNLRPDGGRIPGAAIVLIVVGVVLLFDTLDLIHIARLIRFWPLGLIALGFYMLYNRMHPYSTDRSRKDAEAGR